MFGRCEGRYLAGLSMAVSMVLACPSSVMAAGWELERESGVGGGPSRKAEAAADPVEVIDRAETAITVDPIYPPVIRPAEGVPVDRYDEAEKRRDVAEAAFKAVQSKTDTAVAAAKAALPAARDSLDAAAATQRTFVITAVDKAPAVQRLPEPSAELMPAPVEQAQLAPNTAAAPKAILPPRAHEAPSEEAFSSAISPSPQKPLPAEPRLQQALLAPNVAASPKERVLRTAPAPDNKLVELVETPTDYALTLSPGKGQLLNFAKAVTDVFVADPNIADVNVFSATQVSVHGNRLGRTSIFGIDGRGDVVLAVDVEVVPDASAAQNKLDDLAPAGQTTVALRSDTLVAEGTVADVGEAVDVAYATERLAETEGPTVNATTIDGSQQVNIRVRFAEVSRTDVFNLGINWESLVDTGDFLFGLSTGPGAVGQADAFGSIFGNAEFGDVNVDAFIDALQREGIVNLLAEPNLTAINGEPANFLAGGEIPIPVPGGGGNDTVTIDYKPFGVSLDFVPTLLPGERINLRVRPEVSSINAAGGVVIDGFSIPAFTVRRAETSVELASGQTFAIAGLFQRDLTTDTDKFPVLGDVPVLGQLFQSQRFLRSETELVILITPYLVKPTSSKGVALPNDRLDGQASALADRARNRAGFIVN